MANAYQKSWTQHLTQQLEHCDLSNFNRDRSISKMLYALLMQSTILGKTFWIYLRSDDETRTCR